MKVGLSVMMSIAVLLVACQRNLSTAVASPQSQDPPSSAAKVAPEYTPGFRLYKTQNMWTMLLLDTRTGLLWQANYSVDAKASRILTPVLSTKLADGPNGRFFVDLKREHVDPHTARQPGWPGWLPVCTGICAAELRNQGGGARFRSPSLIE